MNIVMIHYKCGSTDGVSLEMDKWKLVLEKIGHNVKYLAGEIKGEMIYPPLFHTSKIAKNFYAYSFQSKPVFKNEVEYKDKLYIEVEKCETIIRNYIKKNKIDLIIAQNVFSVAMNIAVAIALENVVKELDIKLLSQHHDFFWERKAGVNYGCDFAKEIADNYLPPTNKRYKHVVINKQGHDTLLKRKGLESTIIPNVFDFEAPQWEIDDYNKDFKKALGINENDIILLQATRIVDRKAIELAIDTVSKMNEIKSNYYNMKLYNGKIFKENSNLTILLAGNSCDDDSGTYLSRLISKAKHLNVKIKVISDRVDHSRKVINKKKIYSLWDTYVYSDLITYPSYWEGWGNQFLEGLFAKKPMIVFEYPVFLTDIKDKGFDYISLGNSYNVDKLTELFYVEDAILHNAASKAFEYLFNIEKRKNSVNKNFIIGKKYFSLESLEILLEKIINDL